MKNTYYLCIFLVALVLAGCHLVQDYYDDDYQVNNPAPTKVSISFPGIADFVFMQQSPASTTPSDTVFNNQLQTTWLAYRNSDSLQFIVQLFQGSNFTDDNLVLKKRLSVRDATPEIKDLGTTTGTVLKASRASIIILDSGEGPASQVAARGYYVGTFVLSKNDSTVAAGPAYGYMSYDGTFRFSLKGFSDTRYVEGAGIDVPESGFSFQGDILAPDGSRESILADTLRFDASKKSLSAGFKVPGAAYNHFIIKLTQSK